MESGGSPRDLGHRVMTVAYIREHLDPVEVLFDESARIYLLARGHPEFRRILSLLNEAKRQRRPVRVDLRPPESAMIADVR